MKDFGKGTSGFTNVRILVPISVVTIEGFSHRVGIILAILSVSKNLYRSQIDFSLGSGWRAHKLTLWINSGAWAGVHSITSIDDGRWHHVTGVYDGNHLKVYVDGLEEGKNKIGKVIGGSTPEHVAIGSDGFGREFWQGVIDEVALFNVALTDKDVQQFMNEGLSSLVMAVSASGKLVDTWSNLKTRQ